jgi:hypothetical protein
MKFVVYIGSDEVLIGVKKEEKGLIKEWFGENGGRCLDDYDREVVNDSAVKITAKLHVG